MLTTVRMSLIVERELEVLDRRCDCMSIVCGAIVMIRPVPALRRRLRSACAMYVRVDAVLQVDVDAVEAVRRASASRRCWRSWSAERRSRRRDRAVLAADRDDDLLAGGLLAPRCRP